MGSGGGGTTTNTTVNKLPQFIEDGGAENWNYAQQIADNLAQPYQGNMVASINPTQQQAFQMAGAGATMAQPAMYTSQNALAQNSFGQADQTHAGNWLNANQQGYMNPYVQNVVDTSMSAMEQQRQKALSQTGDQALSAGAFGGSRHGVMEGAANAQSIKDQASLAAQLYSQGYQNAQTMFNTDADRDLTAQHYNQAADLQSQQNNTDAARKLADVGMLSQNSMLQGASAVQAVGDNYRQYEQDLLNQEGARYDAMRNLPVERLGLRTSALSLTPYGTMSQSQSTTSGSGNGLGSAIGGIGSLMGAVIGLSDENVKKDKTNLGITDPKTGADLYSYRYNDEPKSAPKRVGPMAQDLAAQGRPTADIGGVKTASMDDLVTPTVAAVATKKGMGTARTLLGSGNGPGLLSDVEPPKMPAAPKKNKGKKR